MAKSSNRPRRTIFLLAVYGLFLLFWVAPKTVWCHKAGDRVEIETETTPGECPCEECQHCREHRHREPREIESTAPALKAIPCAHVAIDSATGKEAAPEGRKFEVLSFREHALGSVDAGIQDAAGGALPPGLASIFEPPPPSRPNLRC